MNIKVRIEGTRPLLMDRFVVEDLSPHSRRPGKKDPTAELAEQKVYRLNGAGSELYIPWKHVLYCIREGARQHKIGRRSAWPMILPSVNVSPEKIPLGITEYEVDVQSCVNQANGSRVAAVRARIDKWALEFDLSVIEKYVPADLVHLALQDGGVIDGIGAFRALYGKFVVTKWELQEK